jgi:hypothetical protein
MRDVRMSRNLPSRPLSDHTHHRALRTSKTRRVACTLDSPDRPHVSVCQPHTTPAFHSSPTCGRPHTFTWLTRHVVQCRSGRARTVGARAEGALRVCVTYRVVDVLGVVAVEPRDELGPSSSCHVGGCASLSPTNSKSLHTHTHAHSLTAPARWLCEQTRAS